MSSKLTILFAPMNGLGHVNACLGIAQVLQKRGHRVVFAIDKGWKEVMENEGFHAEFHSDLSLDPNFWPNFAKKHWSTLRLSLYEIYENFGVPVSSAIFESIKNVEDQCRDMIKKVNPDIIVIDSYICSPALTNTKPWVWLMSANPLVAIDDDRTPPKYSGLSINCPKTEWDQFRTKARQFQKELHHNINEWVISKGAPPIPEKIFHPFSQYLNIYMYPEEIDYIDLRPLPLKWHRFDNFMRVSNEAFVIPEKLKNKCGNLIYVSMGSFMSGDLSMMIRLMNILKEIPHRFIISMGNLLENTHLGDNMWGQPILPQVNVLPFVDLVITHGGNNTVTETFYYGKPMIVLPFCSDGFDNSQRIDENGFGKRLNPFTFTKEELSNAIEILLNDKELHKRLDSVSKRIQSSNCKKRAADLIEKIIN